MSALHMRVSVQESANLDIDFVYGKALLEDKKIFIGVTEDTARQRTDTSLSNVFLAAYHSAGDPGNNIPARPILVPAMQQPLLRLRMLEALQIAAIDAFGGQTPEVGMQLAGEAAASDVKNFFYHGNTWRRNSLVTVLQKGFDQPLVEHGELRHAITSELRED